MVRRPIVVILLAVLLLAAALVGYQRLQTERAIRGAAGDLQTARVQRGTIVATVFAVGNVVPSREVSLVFPLIGTVRQVNVQAGDQVAVGQVLATLEASDLEQEVANAQLNLTIREAELARLTAGPTSTELAAAQTALKAAQEALAELRAGPRAEDVASARSALQAAQAQYNLLQTQPNAEAVRQAQLQLEYAKNNLWHVQSQRDMACGIERAKSLCDSFEAEVGSASVQVQMAELALQQAQQPASEAQLQSALSQVQAAQAALDKLLVGPSKAAIAAAEAEVARAQAALDALTGGARSEEIAIAEARLQQARLLYEQAQRRLADATLVAPYAGVIASVGYRVGDLVRPEMPGIVLADLSELQIKVNVAEVDIDQVRVGQEAEVLLDALPERPLKGQVAAIAPAARSEQGVVNYPITIALREGTEGIKPGMTGNVRITVGRRENVLYVPNRAIRRSGGQRVVAAVRDGQIVETPVRIGLNNDTVTEIVEGVRAGEVVVLNLTTSQSGLGGGLLGGGQ